MLVFWPGLGKSLFGDSGCHHTDITGRSSSSDMIYRERMYTVDRIGSILASFRELPASVPVLALLFVKKFASDIRRGGPLAAALSSGGAYAVDEFIVRAFTAGMMMADKVVDEACFSLKTW